MDKHHPFGKPNFNNTENTDGYNDSTVNVANIFYHVLDKAVYIIISIIIGALLMGFVANISARTLYSSTAKLYLINTTDVTLTTSDLQVANYLVNDYLAVFTTKELHDLVAEELDNKYSVNELSSMVSVSNDLSTHIINITIEAHSANEAQTIADVYADLSRDVIEAKLNVPEPVIFENASKPIELTTASVTQFRIIGAMVGLFIALIAVIIQAVFDDRIRTPYELEQQFGLQTLGFMTDNKKNRQQRLSGRGRH